MWQVLFTALFTLKQHNPYQQFAVLYTELSGGAFKQLWCGNVCSELVLDTIHVRQIATLISLY